MLLDVCCQVEAEMQLVCATLASTRAQVQLRLNYGSMKALLRRSQGSSKALLRRSQGSIEVSTRAQVPP